MSGTWIGTASYPAREAGGVVIETAGSGKFKLELKQSRAALSGMCYEKRHFGANPLGNERDPENREGEIIGEVSKNNNFSITVIRDGKTAQTLTGKMNDDIISGIPYSFYGFE